MDVVWEDVVFKNVICVYSERERQRDSYMLCAAYWESKLKVITSHLDWKVMRLVTILRSCSMS